MAVFTLVFGAKDIYQGVKQKGKWAKTAAILMGILVLLLLIGGILLYMYAVALSNAFKMGL